MVEMWPEVAGRLGRSLARRGVPASTIEDVLQEVALRVVRRGIAFETVEDLARWAYTVGHRLVPRISRPTSPRAGDDGEESSVDDQVMARLDLATVATAIAGMAAADQLAFASVFSPPTGGTKRDRDRVALQLHRARWRLSRLIDGLIAAAGLLWARRRLIAAVSLGGAASVALTTIGALDIRPPADDAPTFEPAGAHHPVSPSAPVEPAHAEARAPIAHPRRGATATPTSTPRGTEQIIDVALPTGDAVGVGLEQNDRTRPLLCIENFPVLNGCVAKPRINQ